MRTSPVAAFTHVTELCRRSRVRRLGRRAVTPRRRRNSHETAALLRASGRRRQMWRRHAARLAARCSRYAAGGGLACFAAGAATGLASWSDGRAACKGKPTTPQLQSFNTRVSDIHLDYEFGPQLGSGAYGNVYRGRCKATGKVVAIKAMPKRKENMAMVRAEVAALRRGALHRSISEIYDFYEAPTVFYIVMEFVDGGELLDH